MVCLFVCLELVWRVPVLVLLIMRFDLECLWFFCFGLPVLLVIYVCVASMLLVGCLAGLGFVWYDKMCLILVCCFSFW